MADADETTQVKLLSADGQVVEVPLRIANMSATIANMIQDIGLAELGEGIPLPNVSLPILTKVIDYCDKHKDDPPSKDADDTAATKRTDDIEPWDFEFCKVEQATLFELILAANYLDIPSMLDLGCKTVANMIKGKTPEQIRQTFNIKNDFTPEEQKAVEAEHEWCKEADTSAAAVAGSA